MSASEQSYPHLLKNVKHEKSRLICIQKIFYYVVLKEIFLSRKETEEE